MLSLIPAYVVYVHQLLYISDSLTGRQSQETLVAVSQTEAATADEDSEVNQILSKQRILYEYSCFINLLNPHVDVGEIKLQGLPSKI